jgi:hypothetical protein
MRIRNWLRKGAVATSRVENDSNGEFYVDSPTTWQKVLVKDQAKPTGCASSIIEVDECPTVPNLTLTIDEPNGSLAPRNRVGYDPYDTGQFDSSRSHASKSKQRQ